ncbi:MAG: hypothetical protein ABIN83_07110 [Sphingomicrobium sp.]
MSAAVAAGLLLQACSSRPRAFAPTLAAPASGQAAFEQTAFDRAYAECNQLLVAGKLDSTGRIASAGAGAAAGTAAAVAGGALASSMVPAVGMALASATIVLIPFVALGSAVGMSKVKRAKKEKAIKAAMGGCLGERGYQVTQWVRANNAP